MIDDVQEAVASRTKEQEERRVSKSKQTFELQRQQKALEAGKHFFGEYKVPVALLHPPLKQMAARDFHLRHKEHVQKNMWNLGTQYPSKPGVICCFGVIFFDISFIDRVGET